MRAAQVAWCADAPAPAALVFCVVRLLDRGIHGAQQALKHGQRDLLPAHAFDALFDLLARFGLAVFFLPILS